MIETRTARASSGMIFSALTIAVAILSAGVAAFALAAQGRAAGHPPALAAGVVSIAAGASLCGVAASGRTRLALWVFGASFFLAFIAASAL